MANQRYVGVGRETAYGTAVASTKSFEDTGDDWTLQTSPVTIAETTRSAQQAALASQLRSGGQGSVRAA